MATRAGRPDARLGLGHADAPERWVDVPRVAIDAVGHPPRGVVQQVAGDDLVVVVGGVGKGAAAVALAERPHPRHAGLQGVVHLDVAASVHRVAGRLQPQVVGVGTTGGVFLFGTGAIGRDVFWRTLYAARMRW